MSIFDRLFGKKSAELTEAAPAAGAQPGEDERPNKLSLQILYGVKPSFGSAELTERLRRYDPSMADGEAQIDPEGARTGTPFGRLSWGEHAVDLVGFDVPMPQRTCEMCIQPAHYPEPVKQQARAHVAHALLYYAGSAADPYEQYIALAAAAGVLSEGAVVVMNEAGHTSLPVEVFALEDTDDRPAVLRSLPLPLIFVGMVKYNLPRDSRVWMRTHGAYLLGLPELAYWASGHQEGQSTMDLYDSTLSYLLTSKAQVAPGHTLQVGSARYIKFRSPGKADPPSAPGERLLVVENIRPDSVNR